MTDDCSLIKHTDFSNKNSEKFVSPIPRFALIEARLTEVMFTICANFSFRVEQNYRITE